MFRLIETIRFHDGRFNNLVYHERRMRRALKGIYGAEDEIKLEMVLNQFPKPGPGLYKCRLMYDNKSNLAEFTPYQARPVNSLKLIYDDNISYPHKFCDRTGLENHFGQRGVCDDVLIIRNGMVTDTAYANIAMRRGKEWFTPWSFLLAGTMRQSLLDRKLIREVEMKVDEIVNFESFKIINAMLMFDAQEVSIENIAK